MINLIRIIIFSIIIYGIFFAFDIGKQTNKSMNTITNSIIDLGKPIN